MEEVEYASPEEVKTAFMQLAHELERLITFGTIARAEAMDLLQTAMNDESDHMDTFHAKIAIVQQRENEKLAALWQRNLELKIRNAELDEELARLVAGIDAVEQRIPYNPPAHKIH